ncbi:solute carrier family 1 (glial high affinity glutamate transporter), member 3 [Mytilus galloprovincialis]|uniref:Amino acid transporter n=1 Tax=Mytilus galloprovincialis TaxID=29158 RepID=A0A8B6BPQ9_MYTGA|nr:solute carrier family 1 (glial high affinity glutamate transporter), member 3 [Mytilus galloprovincialis]
MEDNKIPQKVDTHIVLPMEKVEEEDESCREKCHKNMKENLILLLLFGSVVFGCGFGFIIRASTTMTKREIMYLQFPGEILMRMLKMLILPLVISSLIAGIAGLDAKACGKIGLRTMLYFGATTFMAVVLGIIMAVSIQPGRGAKRTDLARYGSTKKLHASDTFLDLIRNMFPDNLIVSCFTGYRTSLEPENQTKTVIYSTNDTNFVDNLANISKYTDNMETLVLNFTNGSTIVKKVVTTTIDSPVSGETGQINILGLVVFSVLIGVVLGRMGHKAKPIVDFCTCLTDASMNLFVVFIWYSPIGIAFLIAGKIVAMEDFGILLTQVGLYFLTVLIGLLIHGTLILPALFFICTRRNPYKFIYGILQAMATAFGTSSSSATMPVTLHCLEHNNGVDPRVAGFVIPVGATINMDGTALYEAVAALFIAQVNNATLSFGQIVTISITATAASIGAAGVPQAGLVTMVIVLAAVGLPTEDITLILVVDWFLDRFRTMTNVTGDSLGAGIVYYLSKNELPPLHTEEQEYEMHVTSNKRKSVPNGTDAMTAV